MLKLNKKEEIVKLYYEDNLTQKEIAEKVKDAIAKSKSKAVC